MTSVEDGSTRGQIKPEESENVIELNYKSATADWINEVSKILGEPVEVQRPLNESDIEQEIAVYSIPTVSNQKNSTLTITRDPFSREPHFKVDLRTDDKEIYSSLISKFTVNTNTLSICFSPPDSNEYILRGKVAPTNLKIYASGEVEQPPKLN